MLRSLLLAGIVLLLLSFVARAGDFATLNFIGFSKDGRYLAYEEYGTQDGSGFPYASFFFVDVEKNTFAAKSVIVRLDSETATERQARAKARLQAAALLRKFRIVERNTGITAVSRQLTDASSNHFLSENPASVQKINFAEIIGSMYRRGDYELTLKSVPVKSKDCDSYDDYEIHMLELKLEDRGEGKTIMLQKDSTLPASRSCPINYAIQYVYLYESSIVVFLNTYNVGFEGPDMRYMAVAGKIK